MWSPCAPTSPTHAPVTIQKYILRDLPATATSPSDVTGLVFRREVGCVVVSPAWEMGRHGSVRFLLPRPFEAFCDSFSRFYDMCQANSSGTGAAPRKLTWLYGEGSAVVSASLGSGLWSGDLLLTPLQVRCD